MQDNNKTLLGALIIIGIIIIVILLSRTGSPSTYSFRGTTYTASALPLNIDTRPVQTGMYSFVRYVPAKTRSYSSNSSYTYYTYPETQYYDYGYQTYQDNGTVFPDGCTLTSPVSTTTGLPCS